MSYTFRDIAREIYRKSGIVAKGMTMKSDQLQDAIDEINIILDEIYAEGYASATIAVPVTFNGQQDYTVGPLSSVAGDPVPDIELPLMPHSISEIIINIGTNRTPVWPLDPTTYHSRPLNNINTSYPRYFFFERTNPLGTIRFYEGSPSGSGEIIYSPQMVNVNANTDYKYFPRELRPYLIYKGAISLMENYQFDTSSMELRANNAWNAYTDATYEGSQYPADQSAPGSFNNNDSYNILRGR